MIVEVDCAALARLRSHVCTCAVELHGGHLPLQLVAVHGIVTWW